MLIAIAFPFLTPEQSPIVCSDKMPGKLQNPRKQANWIEIAKEDLLRDWGLIFEAQQSWQLMSHQFFGRQPPCHYV